MVVERTALDGVLILTPPRIEDARGFFSESYSRRALENAGIHTDFVQDNQSLSRQPDTIRGLHYQAPPHAQAKLVRCGRGALYDVAVDIRRGSPTYGHWLGVELSFGNGRQLLIPEGFLHGFVTQEPDTEIIYKCSAYYAPECEGTVLWNDPDIGIDWGLGGVEPVLSKRDAAAKRFAELDSPFTYDEHGA